MANIRPGTETENYLRRTVTRLTLFGSLALGIIAVSPFVFEYVGAQFGLSLQNLAVGGTGLLIVVSVTLETLRQINSRAPYGYLRSRLLVTYANSCNSYTTFALGRIRLGAYGQSGR